MSTAALATDGDLSIGTEVAESVLGELEGGDGVLDTEIG